MLWLIVVFKAHSDWLMRALTAELTFILDSALTTVPINIHKHVLVSFCLCGSEQAVSTY